jgi:hypothetical protein
MPLDCDVTPFDNSRTKKEGVSRTYKGVDGYAPMAAYVGQEGYCLELELREGSQHCQKGTPAFLQRVLGRARTLTWIYGALLEKAPPRRYATAKRTEYAFGDLRRALAKDLGAQGFGIDCQGNDKATRNPLIAAVMDLVA